MFLIQGPDKADIGALCETLHHATRRDATIISSNTIVLIIYFIFAHTLFQIWMLRARRECARLDVSRSGGST